MLRRIQRRARGFGAALACAWLAAAPVSRAQNDEYRPPLKATESDVALLFLAGRYAMPITCKKTDGTVVELEESISFKPAPDAGGANSLKVTFFGVDIGDVSYCYNLVERRIVDRRGTLFVRYRSHNREDLGLSDFRRSAARGPLTYWAHSGELTVRGIGTDSEQPPGSRMLPFDGGESKLVVDAIAPGSDGAKLLADYESRAGIASTADRKRFAMRFSAKDGTSFVFYGVDAARARK
jgi:hypothetical protein